MLCTKSRAFVALEDCALNVLCMKIAHILEKFVCLMSFSSSSGVLRGVWEAILTRG